MLDNVLMALQSLRANKMRALLTMLGIIIGIGSVIAIETVGSSLSGSITDSMSGFGVSDITVSLTEKEDEDAAEGMSLRLFRNSQPSDGELISDDMINEFLAAFPDKVQGVKLTQSVGSASYGSDGATLTVMGINDEYPELEEIKLLYGRTINNAADSQRNICLVADVFVEDYLDVSAPNAVGQQLYLDINGTPCTFYIAGVYEYSADDELTMSSSDETVTQMYIPMKVAKTMTGAGDGYSSLTVVSAAGVDTTVFISTVEEYFASYYMRNDSWTAQASSMESLVSTLTEMLDTVSLAISAIAAISLLVGGIGVMNIMLVSVTERTREIGTRKALGAPKGTILVQFIIESVVICIIGGILGVAVGTALGAVACNVLGYSARADGEAIVFVVAVSTAIGVFFGYYPANKASKLDPIEALRYE